MRKALSRKPNTGIQDLDQILALFNYWFPRFDAVAAAKVNKGPGLEKMPFETGIAYVLLDRGPDGPLYVVGAEEAPYLLTTEVLLEASQVTIDRYKLAVEIGGPLGELTK